MTMCQVGISGTHLCYRSKHTLKASGWSYILFSSVRTRYFEKRGKIICSVHIISRHCGGGPALEREIRKRMCYLKKDPLSVYICEILNERNIISSYSRNLSRPARSQLSGFYDRGRSPRLGRSIASATYSQKCANAGAPFARAQGQAGWLRRYIISYLSFQNTLGYALKL